MPVIVALPFQSLYLSLYSTCHHVFIVHHQPWPAFLNCSFLPLPHYIYLYHQKFRPQLLMGNAHDFFSLANSRTPFSASSYSNISALFKQHFSVKLTTNDLRKCVVDYLLSLPASGDHALRYFLLSFFTATDEVGD